MIDIPGTDAADALRRMHNRFAVSVTVTGAGLTNGSVMAVPGTTAGEAFHGPGRSARTTRWDVMRDDLPDTPVIGMTINDGTTVYEVIDIEHRPGTASVRLIVEVAA